DQKNDQHHFRMVLSKSGGDVLKKHCLTGTGRRNDQGALAFADRREDVENPGRHVLGAPLEFEFLHRVERGQVVENDLFEFRIGARSVDVFHFEQSEVALAVFRGTNLAGDGVAGTQVESTDLRRADVDIVGTREIV